MNQKSFFFRPAAVLSLLFLLPCATPARAGSGFANDDVYTTLAYASLLAAGTVLDYNNNAVSAAWSSHLRHNQSVHALMRTVGLVGLLFGSNNPASRQREWLKVLAAGYYLYASGTGDVLYQSLKR